MYVYVCRKEVGKFFVGIFLVRFIFSCVAVVVIVFWRMFEMKKLN